MKITLIGYVKDSGGEQRLCSANVEFYNILTWTPIVPGGNYINCDEIPEAIIEVSLGNNVGKAMTQRLR